MPQIRASKCDDEEDGCRDQPPGKRAVHEEKGKAERMQKLFQLAGHHNTPCSEATQALKLGKRLQRELGSSSQLLQPPSAASPHSGSAWQTEGSGYIGRGVIREVTENDGRVYDGEGRVTGWLPANESDFMDEHGCPAALWLVDFEDDDLGSEELEEHEIKEALIA